jgi:hypothetical protein
MDAQVTSPWMLLQRFQLLLILPADFPFNPGKAHYFSGFPNEIRKFRHQTTNHHH